MSKKQVVIAIVLAVIAVAAAFGFSSFMAGREAAWKDEGASLTVLAQVAVTAARLIRHSFLLIAPVLVAGSFFVVWLAGLLFRKK